MTTKKREFTKGIRLRPDTDALEGIEGEFKVDSADNQIKTTLGSASREVITNDQTQTLENKTIDATAATGNNTLSADAADIEYDNGTSSLAATDVQAAIDELKTGLDNQNEASEIDYDNTTSGLTATDVQAAIDEVEERVDTIEASYVESFNSRTGAVTPQASDYDADQVDYDNATSGLTATDVQAAIDEVEGRVDTIEGATYVNSFEGRTGAVTAQSGDYQADEVTYDNATSGLTATDVQAAIDEVDGDLDAHIAASSGVHGVTGDVVGTTDTQDLSNKTFTDAITLEEQSATPSNPAAGDKKFYAKDDGFLYTLDSAGNEIQVGAGGGGGLDVFVSEDFELTSASDFSTGNNATVLGGGTLQGTLADETSNPLAGDSSLSFTVDASSLNDYFASPIIELDEKQQGNTIGFNFVYTFNGADDDIRFFIYDDTNDEELNIDGSSALIKQNSTVTRFTGSVFIPSGVTQIRYGFQVEAASGGAVLEVDDLQLSTNPFVYKNLVNLEEWQAYTPTISGFGTISNLEAAYKRVGDSLFGYISFTGGTLNGATAATSYIELPSGLDLDTSKENDRLCGTFAVEGTNNHTPMVIDTSLSTQRLYFGGTSNITQPSAITSFGSSNQPVSMEFGPIAIDGWNDETEHVITPTSQSVTTEQFLTSDVSSTQDLVDLQFSNLTIGQSYIITGNIEFDVVAGGAEVRAYSASGGSGTLYGSLGEMFDNAGSSTTNVHTSTPSLLFTAEAETLYIRLVVNLGSCVIRGNSTKNETFLQLTNVTRQFLAAIPVTKTAYLKDVKPSGTNGGTSTSGGYFTRTLNTVEGDSEIVSLSSNQFTLQPGTYEIEATSVLYQSNSAKIKIRNITDSTDEIISTVEYGITTSILTVSPRLAGKITLNSSKVFELQYRVGNGKATDGLGVTSSFGDNEIYSSVKITKLN